MSKHVGKRKQRYVDCMRNLSKLTCIIRGPIHSSGECKVLSDFGSKSTKIRSTMEFRQEPEFKKNRKRER